MNLGKSLYFYGSLFPHLISEITLIYFLEFAVGSSNCWFGSARLLTYLIPLSELGKGIPSSSRCFWSQGAWLAEQSTGQAFISSLALLLVPLYSVQPAQLFTVALFYQPIQLFNLSSSLSSRMGI